MNDLKSDSPGLPRRLAAIVYDSLLVLALSMLVTALVLALTELLLGSTASERTELTRPYVQLAVLLSTFTFFCGFWRRNGQTLGMRAWRLKLVNLNGGTPTVWQCLVRFIGATLSAGCLGLGYLWIMLDRCGFSWHDRLSGTQLIVVEKT